MAGSTPSATQAPRTATPAQVAYAHRCPGKAVPGTGALSEWTSTNWAGYLAARRGSRVTCVEGSWIEPKVTCPSKGESDVAVWVGIDGATWPSEGITSAGTLIQAGTEIHCSAGTARHVAWHEIYPRQPAQQWDMAVRAGDRIWTMVSYSGGRFRLLVANLTTGAVQHVDETVSSAHRLTVEWVIETPAFGCPTACRNLPLARFPALRFSAVRATIGGRLDGVVGPWDRARVTLQVGSTTLASVGPVATNGQSFTISWRHR